MSSSAITGPVFSDARRAPSGTAAAPSFAFNDSTGTGVYLVSAGVLGLSTAGVQRVVVDASGNVGIGTASPQDKMHISSGSGGSITLQGQYEFGAENYNLRLLNDGTTRGYLSQMPAAGGMQLAEGQTYSGSGNYRADGTTAAAINMQGGIITFTTNSGLVAAGLFSPTERMRLDASGNLLVGTTNATVSADNGFRFIPSPVSANMTITVNTSNGADSNYHLYNRNATNNGYRFYVGANGGILNYSANNVNLSDQRVKTDISLAGSYLEKICAIPVKTFRYKDQGDDMDLTLGVIAQDVEAIAPELVNITDGFGETPEDGVPLKTIYQTDLQYALMKCIQEQQEIIGKLEARLAALEAK